MADRISPLAALAEPGEYGALMERPGVTLSEDLPTALVQIACWPDTQADAAKAVKKVLGVAPGEGWVAVSKGDTVILPTGPGRFLIGNDDEGLEQKLRKALKAETASVTDLTHARVRIRVRGEQAAFVLASGLAIDFHKASFAIGTVQMTSHHGIGVTLHRVSADTFDLYVFTSFARSFWSWLTRASEEVGYRVL